MKHSDTAKADRFRFRAWDTNIKMMAVDITLEFLAKQKDLAVPHLNVALQRAGKNGLVLMQSTGLTDSKDREIFEGDILEIEGATAKVVWWGRPPEFGLDYNHNEDKWCEDWNITDDSCRMTIIGSIYENPDLLPS